MPRPLTNLQATRAYVENLKKERDQLEQALRTLVTNQSEGALLLAQGLLKRIDDRG